MTFKYLSEKLLLGIVAVSFSVSIHAATYPVRVENFLQGELNEINATNEGFAPVLIEAELSKSVNVASDQTWPIRAVIPPRTKQRLALLGPKNRHAATHWAYKYKASIGDPAAVTDQDFVYRLPFVEGTRFLIGQGYDAHRTTHTSASDFYAIDFSVPEGTPVLAARGGIITDIEMENVYGGMEKSLSDKANYVLILHDDGSFGRYVHLKAHSSLVITGQRVEPGQPIALSGNTGYSSGPHLHFVVEANSREGMRSFPLVFANGNPAQRYVFDRTGATGVVNYSENSADRPPRPMAAIVMPPVLIDSPPDFINVSSKPVAPMLPGTQRLLKDPREEAAIELRKLLKPVGEISGWINRTMGGGGPAYVQSLPREQVVTANPAEAKPRSGILPKVLWVAVLVYFLCLSIFRAGVAVKNVQVADAFIYGVVFVVICFVGVRF